MSALQLDIWIAIGEHSNDDQQIEQTKILKLQKVFQDKDIVRGDVIGFLNIYDKGYHQLLQAMEKVQRTLVPESAVLVAESGESLLRTASTAVTRSRNERAVKRFKISNYVNNGGKEGWPVHLICDIWEAWTFRVNFMYGGYQS